MATSDPGGRDDDRGSQNPSPKASAHGRTFGVSKRPRKTGSLRRGFVLVETMMTLSILTVLGLVLLKLSLNIIYPRQWGLQQTLSDAYMTYERSYAERIPFSDLLADNSPWPASPNTASTQVEIGRLPGGEPVRGTVIRTRVADSANYPVDGGANRTEAEALEINPAAMKVWKAQSVLTYTVGTRTYIKSRTVIRSQ